MQVEMDEEERFNDGSEQPVASGSGSGEASGSAEERPSEPPMSKKAIKRAARRAHLESTKHERRAAEKERRKIRQIALKEGYNNGTLNDEDKALFEKRITQKKLRYADRTNEDDLWGGGVVIDLAFDELMTNNEISSMASQLGYVYSANRLGKRPFATILHTSFGPTASPRLWERMRTREWDRWKRCHWWEQDVGELNRIIEDGAGQVGQEEDLDQKPQMEENPGEKDLTTFLTGPKLPPALDASRHTVVYLSADSEEELTTLSEDEIYVIGGIVDRNRHKFLCQEKAVNMGIRTARLPIGTYLADLPTRKVLTVNQVFEILVKYVEMQDWAQAFDAVIPCRKYQAVGNKAQKRRRHQDSDGAESAEDVAEEREGDGAVAEVVNEEDLANS